MAATYTIKFTRRAIDAIKPTDARITYRDPDIKGVILICYPSGRKTFFYRRSISNRDERFLLGEYSLLFGPEQAQKKAAAILGAVYDDKNPADIRRQVRAEPTLAELLRSYIETHTTKSGRRLAPRTIGEAESVFKTHCGAIQGIKPSKLDVVSVKAVLREIKSDAQKLKTVSLLSSLLNHHAGGSGTALRGQLGTLPKLQHRERHMSDEETQRFLEAVERSELGDFFMLALLTGQRRKNLCEMKWVDVDLEAGRWTISRAETKNRQTMSVDLAPEAIEILRARKTNRLVGIKYVFPSETAKSGHITEPHSQWKKLLKEAQIEGLRIHDLRHTLASWLINSGHSIDVVGSALGHKSNAASRIYAHLTRETVGNAVAGVVADKLKKRCQI
jgi:integrase